MPTATCMITPGTAGIRSCRPWLWSERQPTSWRRWSRMICGRSRPIARCCLYDSFKAPIGFQLVAIPVVGVADRPVVEHAIVHAGDVAEFGRPDGVVQRTFQQVVDQFIALI